MTSKSGGASGCSAPVKTRSSSGFRSRLLLLGPDVEPPVALLRELLHPPPRAAAHVVLLGEEEAVDLDEGVLVHLVQLAHDPPLVDVLPVRRDPAVREEVDRVDER